MKQLLPPYAPAASRPSSRPASASITAAALSAAAASAASSAACSARSRGAVMVGTARAANKKWCSCLGESAHKVVYVVD